MGHYTKTRPVIASLDLTRELVDSVPPWFTCFRGMNATGNYFANWVFL